MDFLNGINSTLHAVAPIAETTSHLLPLLSGMGEDIQKLHRRHQALVKHLASQQQLGENATQKANARVAKARAKKNTKQTGGNYEIAGNEMVGGKRKKAPAKKKGGNYEIAGDEVIGAGGAQAQYHGSGGMLSDLLIDSLLG